MQFNRVLVYRKRYILRLIIAIIIIIIAVIIHVMFYFQFSCRLQRICEDAQVACSNLKQNRQRKFRDSPDLMSN